MTTLPWYTDAEIDSMCEGLTSNAAKLRGMLDDACKTLAKDQQAAFMTKGWAKLKSHFGVGYRQIPAQEFTEAVSLVSRHIVSFQATKVAALPAPEPMPTKLSPAMLVSLINGGCLAESAVRDIAMASTNHLFRAAARTPSGYGDEVRRRIDEKLPLADLHAIVVAATMEMQLRVHGYDIAQQPRHPSQGSRLFSFPELRGAWLLFWRAVWDTRKGVPVPIPVVQPTRSASFAWTRRKQVSNLADRSHHG